VDRSLALMSVARMRDAFKSLPTARFLRTKAPALALSFILASSACGLKNAGSRSIPAEVEAAIRTVTDDLAEERYQKIYDDSSSLWKRDATLDQSTEVLKRLRTRLGKVDGRALHTAIEQTNSGGPLQGHVFIISYQTKFEQGEGMETFTLLEENGRWALARYLVNSTALK
jgi:Protein of unknown function (DUF4019)